MNPTPHTAPPFITLDGIAVRLGDCRLLENTRWEIRSDQQWAILGPNGSGKTALALAITEDVPIVAGDIVYHFAQCRASDARLPDGDILQVSFADRDLFAQGDATFEQARWFLRDGESGPRVRDLLSGHAAGDLARRLGLAPLMSRHWLRLSNGERRKVRLAAALAGKTPRLLVLDGPFCGLDAESRNELRDIISNLLRGDMRVIVTSPRPEEIPEGFTHIVCVADGRVLAAGPREEVLAHADVQRLFPPPPEAAAPPPAAPRRSPSAAKPIIDLHDVWVRYDRTAILKGVSWTVRRGENWALLGPNGAGKTTLLNMIYGDHPQAYSNDVRLFGRQRGTGESIWDIRRRIGFVSPETQGYYTADVSCLDCVCSGFTATVGLHGSVSTRHRERALRRMADLGIAELADRPLGRVSDGQQRIVFLARALVKEPDLLMLDEPCMGLDPIGRWALIAAVDSVARRHDMSVIYVTHHPEEIPAGIDGLLRLRRGEIVEHRPPAA